MDSHTRSRGQDNISSGNEAYAMKLVTDANRQMRKESVTLLAPISRPGVRFTVHSGLFRLL